MLVVISLSVLQTFPTCNFRFTLSQAILLFVSEVGVYQSGAPDGACFPGLARKYYTNLKYLLGFKLENVSVIDFLY
jgi:hypothetical protein